MKKINRLLILLCTFTLSAQNIEFEDPNFKEVLLNVYDTSSQPVYGYTALDIDGNSILIDANNDGEISELEVSNIYDLELTFNLSVQNVNLSGIEYFYALKKLSIFNWNSDFFNLVVEINFESITNLEKLSTEGCHFDSMNLDFGDFSALKELSLSGNPIESINLNSNIFLEKLQLSYSNLSQLDLSNNYNLSSFYFWNTGTLSSIDLSNNPIIYLGLTSFNLNAVNLKNGIPAENLQPIYDNTYIRTSQNYLNLCVDDFNIDNLEDYHIRKFIPGNPNDNQVAMISINDFCSDIPGGSYSTISGTSKMDINANGYDENDISIPFQKLNLLVDENSYNYFSNELGAYSFNLSSNYSDIEITPEPNSILFSTVNPSIYSGDLPFDNPVTQNFVFNPGTDYNDVEIYSDNSPILPGVEGVHSIYITNKGNQTENATVTWQFPSDYMQINSTSEVPTSNTTFSYTWNLPNIEPFETRTIIINSTYNTPTDSEFPLNAGDVLSFDSNINIENTDAIPQDNEFIQNITVVNSYDPNDKACLNGNQVTNEHIGEFLYYKIRFENLGTANAQTVTVVDSIDTAMFDITTFTPIKGSHSFQTEIKDNVAKFTFANIDLPFDDANNDGYVIFKIKTFDTVAQESVVTNQADIYFDYNFPVITNNEQTLFTDNLGVEDIVNNQKLTISPNPVKDILKIDTQTEISHIEIFDTLGRLMQKMSSSENNIFNVENLQNGIYLLKIKTTDNQIITAKIIKQ